MWETVLMQAKLKQLYGQKTCNFDKKFSYKPKLRIHMKKKLVLAPHVVKSKHYCAVKTN